MDQETEEEQAVDKDQQGQADNSNEGCGYGAQGGLSVAGGCRCLTKDGNTSIEKEGYIPYPLQA